jgi:FtsP/CotA-like multicopper oxidase with cupredoxin domain
MTGTDPPVRAAAVGGRILSRRQVLGLMAGGAVVAGGGGLASRLAHHASNGGMVPSMAQMIGPHSPLVAQVDSKRQRSGRPPIRLDFAPAAQTINFGRGPVQTWAYGPQLPGPEIRLSAGDTLIADLVNRLSEPTTIHWHGIAIRNDMDGVDGMTQAAVVPGATFRYEFVVPDPGTYFYHPHYGLQLDRALYGPLIVEDPADPGVDVDAVVVLDDWLDGVAGTPDQAVARLVAVAHGQLPPDSLIPPLGSMISPDLGGMAGDIAYPDYLINGRSSADPWTLRCAPGASVRLRIINAGADTAFRVALAGHQMTVTHADGYPVEPTTVDSVLVGMAERYDVIVRLRSGGWPLVAAPEGKHGLAAGVIRTTDALAGSGPRLDVAPAELAGRLLQYRDLHPTAAVRLEPRGADRVFHIDLDGSMARYNWAIAGPDVANLNVHLGERVRIVMHNRSDMWHPMHLHGHTYAVADFDGVRKDTLIVPPGTTRTIEVQCDNPGTWMFHCHNLYHFKVGMATTFNYVA